MNLVAEKQRLGVSQHLPQPEERRDLRRGYNRAGPTLTADQVSGVSSEGFEQSAMVFSDLFSNHSWRFPSRFSARETPVGPHTRSWRSTFVSSRFSSSIVRAHQHAVGARRVRSFPGRPYHRTSTVMRDARLTGVSVRALAEILTS
jgi:hypothetical protein